MAVDPTTGTLSSPPARRATPRRKPDEAAFASLHIGLINNMPDAALRATERQFASLVRAASLQLPVRLSFYALPGVVRGQAVQGHLAGYSAFEHIGEHDLDALIVTGAEPVTPNLTDEPYWASFAAMVDWAREHTRSTIWSCLAAHAAVLRMDGIRRIRSNDKQFGVLPCTRVTPHALTRGLPDTFAVPHSRWNGLSRDHLDAAGYRVLTRSDDGSVDAFIKQQKSLFVFLQGHPEYDADSLLREYRRDIGRYLNGQAEAPPKLPRGYFDPATEAALARLSGDATRSRRPGLLAEYSHTLDGAAVECSWHSTALCFYRNWLEYLSQQKLSHMAVSHSGVALPAASPEAEL